MFISQHKVEEIRNAGNEVYVNGLFLSSKWFLVGAVATEGLHVVILPDRESAEYCASDLYNITKDERVYLMPPSGSRLERTSRRATYSVQRTAAIDAIVNYSGQKTLIVTYPEALEEQMVEMGEIKESIIHIRKGEEVSVDGLVNIMLKNGFEKTDFVSAPGQFAVRGGIIDIFSYSYNLPYRIEFFGDEVEDIKLFNINTQLSVENVEEAAVYPDISSVSGTYTKKCGFFTFIPKEATLWIDTPEVYKERGFYNSFLKFKRIMIGATADLPADGSAHKVHFNTSPQPVFNKNFELLVNDVRERIDKGYSVHILSEKGGQKERLKNIMSTYGIQTVDFETAFTVHNGFVDHDSKQCCYTDHEIFDRYHRARVRRNVEVSESLTLNDLAAFHIGDYVVHIDYGVGIFGGLVKLNVNGTLREVIKLDYKDNDVVFESVHSVHKISKYKPADTEDAPKINRIGSKTWQNLKSSAKSKLKDMAKELIDLYAKRRETKGFAFSADTYMQQELESSFLYEDTPDQEKATKDVKADMEESYPMDRLICGDVGFGKTEIAVRAAFKAVADSKQVAVLVPTTILAFQHYNTFVSRLKDFPCNIEYLSRLRTAKESKDVLKRLKEGKVDIIIGTHKLVGKDVEFKDLGLLIIDEEQKFGVAAKERLKQMKINVDTLTMTATPIPRTLQFSLLGARDLSIINTPPPNRIPVQTEIVNFDTEIIRDVIGYELDRGGQVFFVHNRVEELPSIEGILKNIFPDADICTAHGQMEPKTLENKILEFMDGSYDILLCTTIISNGIDIANANTIIINQAQNFGLSDLHQLRGRVGRSNKQAFCYLIVPPLSSLTDEARRRLKAIEAFSELGSGFNIAMQDLDIRGAGNLLGAQQSGFISDMGFETYQKILTEALEELGLETGLSVRTDSASNYSQDCTIDTDIPVMIPDTYINIQTEKIRIYKELDSITVEKEVDRFRKGIEDRFGRMPEELTKLFTVVKIRIAAMQLGFEKIIIKNGVMIAHFVSDPTSQYYKSECFGKILQYIQLYPDKFKLKDKNGKLFISTRDVPGMEDAYNILNEMRR